MCLLCTLVEIFSKYEAQELADENDLGVIWWLVGTCRLYLEATGPVYRRAEQRPHLFISSPDVRLSIKVFAKVLVPVDLAELDFAHKALELAVREVKASNGELHLVSVVPGFSNSMVASFISEKEHHDVLARVAAQLKAFAADEIPDDVNVTLRVLQGSPAKEVNRYIKDQQMELVIIRAHHRTKVGEVLLGSVSSRVVERARCSVVVLKD